MEPSIAMKRYPPSGISVLIVGTGLAGLAAAIECHRKGHEVQIVERREGLEAFGEILLWKVLWVRPLIRQ